MVSADNRSPVVGPVTSQGKEKEKVITDKETSFQDARVTHCGGIMIQ